VAEIRNSLTNSLRIFNRTNNLLHYVYWVYTLTKKLTGLEIDLKLVSAEKNVIFAMSAFGFNGLPINLIEITEQSANDMEVKHRTFRKFGKTYITRNRSMFAGVIRHIDINNSGLNDTEFVSLAVFETRKLSNSLPSCELQEIEPLAKPFLQSLGRERKNSRH